MVEPQYGATDCLSNLLRPVTSSCTSLTNQTMQPSRPPEKKGNTILLWGRRENVFEQEYRASYSAQVKVNVMFSVLCCRLLCRECWVGLGEMGKGWGKSTLCIQCLRGPASMLTLLCFLIRLIQSHKREEKPQG